MYNIKVNVTEEDLSDLGRDKEFYWTWHTEEDKDVMIRIHLFKAEEDFGEEEEDE